jgi:Zn-dependent protease
MRFTTKEKKDLLFAGAGISLAFAILLGGGYQVLLTYNIKFFVVFIIAFLTAGTGFLLHELMHKFYAQKYGLYAEFHAFYNWIGLAILFSFFGFIFAAPGAVFIRGLNITREKNGKISLAGPVTNIVLAILFLLILLVSPAESILKEIGTLGLSINSLLAAFNMIPVMPFDGSKIIAWSKPVYYTTTAIAVGLYFLSWFI